jgi:hypothetical protein
VDPIAVPGHGLLLDGDGGRVSVCRELAYDWLTSRGVDEVTADLVTHSAAVERAWWGGEEAGFVAEGHQQARLVTVVQIPDDVLRQAS